MARDTFSKLLATTPAASPLSFALNAKRCLPLILGPSPDALEGTDPADAAAFHRWILRKLRAANADFAAGGYGEDRALYRMSDLYGTGSEEPRTVHLGVDLWISAGTVVHAVLPGVVHSTRDNKEFGDYGPTLILEHELQGIRFHTLYGHLSRQSLQLSPRGRKVGIGEPLGWLGQPHENVGWAPHLHFQIIRELDGREGDYPGVCRASEKATWMARCPDPNLLLRIDALKKPVRRPRVAAAAPKPVAEVPKRSRRASSGVGRT
ncbi:peptidoglycan DD-metalloendopeptidase family protein [Nevskia ramosa]|uniref:peptidoglycan DD-metalloendopeptidase family protein n=2 Tax=Nevskia ramosa TaxID=64002 RepID=UPI0003B4C346|nr:peptidoglycan DD-metalloendopeptidase family protein [Nevskia ramosa]